MLSSMLARTPSSCNLFLFNLTLSDVCLVNLVTNEALDLGRYLGLYEMGDTYSRDTFDFMYIYVFDRRLKSSPNRKLSAIPGYYNALARFKPR